MVLCWIALPVFAVLGVFSAKYRKLAKDSLECIFNTIRLKKCSSGLDDRIRSDIAGAVMKYSPRTAGFFYNNYAVISWLLVVAFIWSFIAGAIGVYNYAQYGNCNGPEETGFCLLNPAGSGLSEIGEVQRGEIIYPSVESDDPIIGNANAELTIIEFGCFTCPYTKQAEQVIGRVVDYYNGRVNFQFKTFPLPAHEFSYEAALASECANEQNKYLEYRDKLFEIQGYFSIEMFKQIAKDLNLDAKKFNLCLESRKYEGSVDEDISAGKDAQIRGTPTFFINNKTVVGPKPFKTFKNIINSELDKIK